MHHDAVVYLLHERLSIMFCAAASVISHIYDFLEINLTENEGGLNDARTNYEDYTKSYTLCF